MIRLTLFLAGGVVLALALGQVFLPRLAASRISSRVGRYGSIQSVSVEAWPAVKLLWGRADSARIRTGSLKLSPGATAKLLWEARGLGDVEVTALDVQEGPLRLSDVNLRKRGSSLTAEARATEADVRAALPQGFGVQLLSSKGGEVRVRASGGLFGLGASVEAVAGASEGKLIARPLGLLSQLRLILFSEPHVYVEGVGASLEDRPPSSYRLTMRATLR
jgi:LmeA-like phospholipid-binding